MIGKHDVRDDLTDRLARELGDPAVAAKVVGAMPDTLVDDLFTLADGSVATADALAYRPTHVDPQQLTALWAFAFGYRFADGDEPPASDAIPPMHQLNPGPTNEALADAIARFIQRYPMPVVAQWEIADVLAGNGVPDVISVEPDVAADGVVTYLSTVGVIDKGTSLARDAGVDTSYVGVAGHADHVVRCVSSTRAAGLTADVPAELDLPTAFDTRSGQPWTRDRALYLATDLFARASETAGTVSMQDLQEMMARLQA